MTRVNSPRYPTIMTETGVTTEDNDDDDDAITDLYDDCPSKVLDHMIHQMMWMATDASTQRTMMTTETVGSIPKKSIA